MARRRRNPEDAQNEILDAAEALLIAEGPSAVTLKRVATAVGISHPGVLHHFRSAERLREALHDRTSSQIRNDLLMLVDGATLADRQAALIKAMTALADPRKGRLLAWLVASGRDPFPDADEQGLAQIAQAIADPSADQHVVQDKLLLVVLAMIGDSLVGAEVRARLGVDTDDATDFRRRVLALLMTPAADTAAG